MCVQVVPEKFQNKTNGVTPRRWIGWCNPELSTLITKSLGSDDWLLNLSKLKRLAPMADDKAFRAKVRRGGSQSINRCGSVGL